MPESHVWLIAAISSGQPFHLRLDKNNGLILIAKVFVKKSCNLIGRFVSALNTTSLGTARLRKRCPTRILNIHNNGLDPWVTPHLSHILIHGWTIKPIIVRDRKPKTHTINPIAS
jgi:hypothetical protein